MEDTTKKILIVSWIFFIITVLMIFAVNIFFIEYNIPDLPNFVTVIVEISVGFFIATMLYIITRKEQSRMESDVKKSVEQQEEISKLVTEIKSLTNEQKKFREGRHRWAIHMMMNELRILKIRIQERKTNEGLSTIEALFKEFSIKQYTREAQRAVHNLEQISNQAGDVVEPIYLNEISEIANIAKYHLEQEKWHRSDLTPDSNFFKLIDSLTNTFEKIYPSV